MSAKRFVTYACIALLLVHSAEATATRLGGSAHGHNEQAAVEVTGFPSAHKLLHDHMSPSVPLVMRQGVKQWSAMSAWTYEYLTEKAGATMIDAEFSSTHSSELDGSYTLAKFLEMFKESSTNPKYKRIHAITEVPQAILHQMHLPAEFKLVLSRGWVPSMWFSGSSESLLHAVGRENINCVVSGTSEFVLINRTLSSNVYADAVADEYARSPVDVDHVDLEKYPLMKDVPFIKAQLAPGDCIYIPHAWFHHVQTREQNIVVNLWYLGPGDEDEKPQLTDAPFSSLGNDMTFDNFAFWKWESMEGPESDQEEPDTQGRGDRQRDEL